MIRKIRVSRGLIDEFFRDGYKRRMVVSNGISEKHTLFNIELKENDAIFWFAMREDPNLIDESPPVVQTFGDTGPPEEEGE